LIESILWLGQIAKAADSDQENPPRTVPAPSLVIPMIALVQTLILLFGFAFAVGFLIEDFSRASTSAPTIFRSSLAASSSSASAEPSRQLEKKS
jgi:ABC-type transport system involved in cytochrome c biogenesis permease subunit